jgi:hypothetical protein
MDKVKGKITEWLTGEGLTEGTTITCPTEERPLKQGDTFECIVHLAGGGEMTVKVTQEDDEGTGRFTLLRTTVLQTRMVVESIGKRLKEKLGADFTVDCGSSQTLGSGVGTTFECTATSATGEVIPLEGQQVDTGGQFSWRPKGMDGARRRDPRARVAFVPRHPVPRGATWRESTHRRSSRCAGCSPSGARSSRRACGPRGTSSSVPASW